MKYFFTFFTVCLTLLLVAQPAIEESTTKNIESVTTPFQDESSDWTAKGVTETNSTVAAFRIITVETKEVYLSTNFNPTNELNASFKVDGKDVRVMEMSIFDQWGELVYHSTLENSWNGETQEGNKAEPGIYVYAVKAKISPYKTTKLSGCVTLER